MKKIIEPGSSPAKPPDQPEITTVLKIGIDSTGHTMVHGQITDKPLCMKVIGDALRAIAEFVPEKEEPHIKIVKPTRH